MSDKTVTFFTETGDKEYKLFSARLPEFREKFPIDQYRLEVKVKSALEYNPKLFELYKDCLAGGLSPREVGLPGLPSSQTYIFEATLLDLSSGAVIEQATAQRECLTLKDWEKGETSARQRLLAVIGFGGDVFDADEKGDMKDQKLSIKPSASANNKPASKQKAAKEETQVVEDASIDADPSVDSAQDDHSSMQASPVEESAQDSATPEADQESSPADPSEEVSPIMRRNILQIEQVAAVKGIELDRSRMTSVSDSKAYLKELMKAAPAN
jgi:hypothetical protein